MFYEEKWINGTLHYRNHPDAAFTPMNEKQLNVKLLTMVHALEALSKLVARAEATP